MTVLILFLLAGPFGLWSLLQSGSRGLIAVGGLVVAIVGLWFYMETRPAPTLRAGGASRPSDRDASSPPGDASSTPGHASTWWPFHLGASESSDGGSSSSSTDSSSSSSSDSGGSGDSGGGGSSD